MQEQPNFLTEAYDFSEVIEKQLAPLVSQIHAICQEKRIPYVCAIAAHCSPEKNEYTVNGYALLIGPERTPPELVLASLAIQKTIPEAVRFGTFCMLNGFTSDTEEEAFADGP